MENVGHVLENLEMCLMHNTQIATCTMKMCETNDFTVSIDLKWA